MFSAYKSFTIQKGRTLAAKCYNETRMSETLEKIGQKLQEARKKQHLTQVEVAEIARVSTNYYAMVERGETNPSIETFESILKALKVKSSKVLPF